MLVLPAFPQAGSLLCVLLAIAIAVGLRFGAAVIGRMQLKCKRHTYQQLCRDRLGMRGEATALAVQLLFLVGSEAAYLIVVADKLAPTLRNFAGDDELFLVSRTAIVLATAFGVCFPLCLLRNLRQLAGVSAFKLLSVAYVRRCSCLGLCNNWQCNQSVWMWLGPDHRLTTDHQVVQLFHGSFKGIFKAIPVFFFAFNVHPIYSMVLEDMPPQKQPEQ